MTEVVTPRVQVASIEACNGNRRRFRTNFDLTSSPTYFHHRPQARDRGRRSFYAPGPFQELSVQTRRLIRDLARMPEVVYIKISDRNRLYVEVDDHEQWRSVLPTVVRMIEIYYGLHGLEMRYEDETA